MCTLNDHASGRSTFRRAGLLFVHLGNTETLGTHVLTDGSFFAALFERLNKLSDENIFCQLRAIGCVSTWLRGEKI